MPQTSAVIAFLACLLALPAAAQDRRYSHCIAIAKAAPGIDYLHQASWTDPVPERSLRISYVGHSMFLIQSEGGFLSVTGGPGETVCRSWLWQR